MTSIITIPLGNVVHGHIMRGKVTSLLVTQEDYFYKGDTLLLVAVDSKNKMLDKPVLEATVDLTSTGLQKGIDPNYKMITITNVKEREYLPHE